MVGSLTGGGAVPLRAFASAASQRSACCFWRGPPNTGSAISSARVLGSASAASTIAESGRVRPGATSRARANSSRLSHNSRTAANCPGFRTL
ncbi:Uncharacterised protein [Mycobacteroides abscessus subsp. abscessus]|nr:Uncharacterised protein [Mycobacteroides abscessus subsp. abscessus]